MAGLIATLASIASGCAAAADEGYTTATAVADALVRRGVPFRVAHHVVGSLVAEAERRGRRRSTRCRTTTIARGAGRSR